MKVFAFDPGKTTGYAVTEVNEKGDDFKLTRCDEIEWEPRLDNLADVLTDVGPDDRVVIETFRLFPHKAMAQIGSQFPSSQVIGNIEMALYILNRHDKISYQNPGDISKVTVLERDLERVAGSPHKIDAYRHARLYFLRHFYLNPFS
jgi:hypothetical protein